MAILEQLKSSTESLHRLSEELNFAYSLSNRTIRKEDYLIMLKRLYLFFTQVAALQTKQESDQTIPASFFEHKAQLVYEDIKALGAKITETALPFQHMAFFENLGFSYVAMGSMLGGQKIHEIIANSQYGENSTFPCSFYASCKESVLSHWKSFVASLKTIPPENHESVLSGATTAYLYFIYLCVLINK